MTMEATAASSSESQPRRRRWRLVLLALLLPLLLGAVLGIGYVLIALRREPEFFLRAQQALEDPEVRRAAAEEFEARRKELTESLQGGRPFAAAFTPQQINAWLAELFAQQQRDALPAEAGPPVLELDAGVIRIGSRVETGQFRGIVSVALRPELVGPNELVLEVLSIRAGELPIPAGRWIEQARDRLTSVRGARLDESPRLRVVLRLDELAPELRDVAVRRLHVGREALTIEGERATDGAARPPSLQR